MALSQLQAALKARGFRATPLRTRLGDEVKLLVEDELASVKVEVNFVFRGTVLPVVQMPLAPAARELFATGLTLPVLNTAELYGSKLVAAMDRQHPRDIFDVVQMLARFGWQSSFIDCFVAYLAGHNRPVHEVLFPTKQPLAATFLSEFQGMTRDELGIEADFCGQVLGQARLMGAWDHFYPDSAFSPSVPTHYVNLPHWLPLSWAEVALLKLPMGEQHSAWQWLPLADAAHKCAQTPGAGKARIRMAVNK